MEEFDFSKVGQQIDETVNTIKDSIGTAIHDVKQSLYEATPKRKELPITKKPEGKAAGILFMVFGGIGMGIFGILTVIAGIVLSVTKIGGSFANAFLVLPMLFFGGMVMVGRGRYLWKRIKRFQEYVKVIAGREYCEIKRMAVSVGKKERYVVKDLKDMIRRGWFLEGHIDQQKTCFMVTNDAHRQYIQLQESTKKRIQEETLRKEEKDREKELFASMPEGKALLQIEEEGREYIRQIREANEAIPGVGISAKLDRLEMISSKILEHIKKKPEKLQDIRKYMNYYMPTVLKLVNSYREFDNQPLQGDNIIQGKKEIEDSLDVVNEAFERMFDQLFQEDILDISSDISVLSTMLSKDGLLGNEFEKEK